MIDIMPAKKTNLTTVEAIMVAIARKREKLGLSLYRVATMSGQGLPVITRFFRTCEAVEGGKGQPKGKAVEGEEAKNSRIGTTLSIAHALGLDFDIVDRPTD